MADVDAAAFLFAGAMEKVAQMRREQLLDARIDANHFKEKWDTWGWNDSDGVRHQIPIDDTWKATIVTFMERGFDVGDLIYFIEVAMGSKARNAEKWRYFCGCCWKELSNRTELARRMVEDGE